MNYLIIGASSGLGRELTYTFAKNKNNLIICSRDKRDLLALKSDIENKHKVEVKTSTLDLTSEESIQSNLILDQETLKTIDGVLFPVGLMFENDKVDLELEKINNLSQANFSSVAFIISKYLGCKSEGTIIGFGSVSGYLGRELNPYYSASKRALDSYFESIGFNSKKKNIKIQFYILGYLETNLSFGKKLILPKGSVKKLSEIVYKNKNKKFKKYFFPFWWRFIVLIIKIIPFSMILKNFRFLK